MKFRFALLILLEFGMTAWAMPNSHLPVAQVETKQPVQLFEQADMNSNQATIPTGQQLVIFNADSEFIKAGLLAQDGKLLLAGYIANRDVVAKRTPLTREQISEVKRIRRYFRAWYHARFPGRPME